MQIYDHSKNRWISLRDTAQYRQKRKLVRDAWIIIGLLMWTLPTPAIIVTALLATCLSFSFLDESEYRFNQKTHTRQ